MNISGEEKRESLNPRNDSRLNESQKLAHEEIKENRKFINYIFRTLNQKKNLPAEMLHRECVELLRSSDKDITRIVDGDKNTCKIIIF